tara:strand:- start:26 stop:229 length:204 start_codon:yes stop_codon:yes gene_type:complete
VVENTGLLAAVAAAVKSLRLALVVDLVDRMQVLELELVVKEVYPRMVLLHIKTPEVVVEEPDPTQIL